MTFRPSLDKTICTEIARNCIRRRIVCARTARVRIFVEKCDTYRGTICFTTIVINPTGFRAIFPSSPLRTTIRQTTKHSTLDNDVVNQTSSTSILCDRRFEFFTLADMAKCDGKFLNKDQSYEELTCNVRYLHQRAHGSNAI